MCNSPSANGGVRQPAGHQYCGRRGSARELDLDHVLPRSRGGTDSWTNLVASCQPCNRRKGRRTPKEADMPLLRKPAAPRWSHTKQLLASAARHYQEWAPFLQVTAQQLRTQQPAQASR